MQGGWKVQGDYLPSPGGRTIYLENFYCMPGADACYITRASANVRASGTKFLLSISSLGGECYAIGGITLRFSVKGPRPHA